MSKDIKIFNACDHIVDGEKYDNSLCPKCYGKGYYFDVNLDINGSPVLAQNSIKLQQEMLKVIIDKKHENVFHPLWGSEFDYVIGSKNINIKKSKMEYIVRSSLEHLKAVQISNGNNFKNMSDKELINKIEFIEISDMGKTGIKVDVMVSNSIGEIFEQSIIL